MYEKWLIMKINEYEKKQLNGFPAMAGNSMQNLTTPIQQVEQVKTFHCTGSNEPSL